MSCCCIKADKYKSQNRDTSVSTKDRVLLVTWNFPPKRGGMENMSHGIYTHLSKEFDVTVIAPYAKNTIKTPNVFRAPIGGIIPFLFYAMIKGIFLCIRSPFRVILGGSLIVSPIIFLLGFSGALKVTCALGLDIIYANPVYQFFVRFSARRMDGIVCISRHTRSLLIDRLGYNGKTALIPPGISTSDYQRVYEKVGNRPVSNRRFVFSIGRLTERKGLIEFLENCFTKLATEFYDLDFIIAGDDPVEAVYHGVGYRKRLERAIERLGLTDRVRLPGWIDEDTKKQLLATCECFVFPVLPSRSDVEGFGIVAIEAAASGRPTIAFDSGGVGDAVIDGRTGELLSPGDYNGMLDAIRSVLKNPLKYKCEIDEIRKRFDWNFLAPRYHDFFDECGSINQSSKQLIYKRWP